uniref:Variant surface glycoprotein 1724 n=1 Tax=Trypanosoma brucei TaxID=5691 RepID=M4T0U5_9TRYP|nr:variant surface glycoprotein 1724 [Trypanosoma brucei]
MLKELEGLLLALFAVQMTGRTDANEAATEIATPCEEKLYFDKLKTHLQGLGSELATAAANHRAAVRRFTLAAAAATNPQQRCLIKGLQSAAKAALNDVEEVVRDLGAAKDAAIEAVNEHLQTVAAARALYNAKTVVTPGRVRTRQAGASNGVKIKLTTTATPGSSCQDLDATTTNELHGHKIEPQKATAIKITDATQLNKALGETLFTATATSTCNGGSDQTSEPPDTVFNACVFGASNNAAAAITTKATYSSVKKTLNIHKGPDDNQCHSDVVTATKNGDKQTYMARLLCELKSRKTTVAELIYTGPTLKKK